jgi:hypothetical protein
MADPTGESKSAALRLDFDRWLLRERITVAARSLPLTTPVPERIKEPV